MTVRSGMLSRTERQRPVRLRGPTEELQSLVFALGTGLSSLESEALTLYLEGNSYEEMAEGLGCDTKTIDNALNASSGRSSRTRRPAKSSRNATIVKPEGGLEPTA